MGILPITDRLRPPLLPRGPHSKCNSMYPLISLFQGRAWLCFHGHQARSGQTLERDRYCNYYGRIRHSIFLANNFLIPFPPHSYTDLHSNSNNNNSSALRNRCNTRVHKWYVPVWAGRVTRCYQAHVSGVCSVIDTQHTHRSER